MAKKVAQSAKAKIARSTKTTVAGILAGLGLLFTEISDQLTATEDWTEVNWLVVLSAVAIGAAGFFSRDDNVSSEGQKLKRL